MFAASLQCPLNNNTPDLKETKGKSLGLVYAQIKVSTAATLVKIIEITTATRITLDSIPIASMVAAAFCNLAGEITLANPPAMAVPAAMTRKSRLSTSEVI